MSNSSADSGRAQEPAPTPYRISEFEKRSGGEDRVVMAHDGYGVAWVSGRGEAENEASAEFIVLACNSYNALTSATERVLSAADAGRIILPDELYLPLHDAARDAGGRK